MQPLLPFVRVQAVAGLGFTLTGGLMLKLPLPSRTSPTAPSAVRRRLWPGNLKGRLQWPKTKANGNADEPCAAGILFADPLLGPLADNGGFSQTFALGAGSPAIGLDQSCPATDQRGLPRRNPCDTGAYEHQP